MRTSWEGVTLFNMCENALFKGAHSYWEQAKMLHCELLVWNVLQGGLSLALNAVWMRDVDDFSLRPE